MSKLNSISLWNEIENRLFFLFWNFSVSEKDIHKRIEKIRRVIYLQKRRERREKQKENG